MREFITLIAKLTGMSDEDKKKLESLFQQIEEEYDIGSINDIDKINEITRDDISIENVEDLLKIDWENLDLDSINLDDFETDSSTDYTPNFGFFNINQDPNDIGDPRVDDFDIENYKINPEKTEERVSIDINLGNIEDNKYEYHGDTWVEFNGKYKTFIKIPDDIEECNISIKLKNGEIKISEPINETIKTDNIPDVYNVDAEVKNKSIVITTY